MSKILQPHNLPLNQPLRLPNGNVLRNRLATSFSNQSSSYKSSPGFYVTRETYQGKHGLSLKLEGIESGINDKAYQRGIVVHGAD